MPIKKINEITPIQAVGDLTAYSVCRSISIGVLSHQVLRFSQLILNPTEIGAGQVLLCDEQCQLFLLDQGLLRHSMFLGISIRRIYGNPEPEQYDREVRQLQLHAAIADRAICRFSRSTSFDGYAQVSTLTSEVFCGLKDRVEVLSCTSNGKYWKLCRSDDRILL